MLNYNIDSVQSAEKLIRICEKYQNVLEVDVIHGRQTIDGCSMLGVYSMIGNIVSLDLHAKDTSSIQKFKSELEKMVGV